MKYIYSYDSSSSYSSWKTILVRSKYYSCHYTDSDCENMKSCTLLGIYNCKVLENNGISSTLIVLLSIILMITI